ncbi:MAG: SCP2 sterol-binding domain-containing protein [Xanthomonadaceae bacterium]|nr:SCP2 sterol-binding domain-containing protein [Xanthomonadaceae bacterium]MDE3073537.1 SCP2 sterol-binding domain-containing protein [Pseudomonadota bacterium]
MPLPTPERFALARARGVIDRVDDGLILLLAARRRMVRAVAALKRHAGVPPRDLAREQQVRQRAQGLAARFDLPEPTAQRLLDLAIGDACRQQGLPLELERVDLNQGGTGALSATMPPIMPMPTSISSVAPQLLRLLPPPRRLAPLLQAVPSRWQHRLLEAAMARVLDAPLREGALDFMRGRRLAIEVSDLRLRWVLELRDDRLCVTDAEAEASVRGSATDLLLLAGRLEDADTLFFQRRLVLTGDTELGLTARNMLERLPWESVPLGLRIVLNRGARFARTARAAHRGETA